MSAVDELEVFLDKIAGDGYYKESVENESDKFQGPSFKYQSNNTNSIEH